MQGVQVLSVESRGQYKVCGAALQALAAEHDQLPVAVVSVAGGTRAGKSFLLDFFLRYLRATEEERSSGAWLGEEDEPLTGFEWRGGCDRTTEGIFMWPQPLLVDVGAEHKQKVCVVLLDTQGSFDSASTVRDSSTVFAVSTLLASRQIYNLSQNIREDDLQYLQLFTEYGKLARSESELKPFQELVFLVRDWAWAYQHPLGAEGGAQLLDKRLQMREGQAAELREVRAHVRDVFEDVACCLLPHPGAAVADPAFTGCLKDISGEFKEGLLRFVPSVLSPERLPVKQINGHPVTLRDFVEYFNTYVDVFNSDTLPEPTTIMQATSAASLESALRACRAAYSAHVSSEHACVPPGAVRRRHDAALLAARAAFSRRRTFVAAEVADARLNSLMQELEGLLAERIAINSARIADLMSSCRASFEAAVHSERCVAAAELQQRHMAAVHAARTQFYDAFTQNDELSPQEEPTDGDDVEDHWQILKQDLEKLLPLSRERNETQIASALAQALELYKSSMDEGLRRFPCYHPRSLRSLHGDCAAAARDELRNRWLDDILPQEYEQQLMISIEELFLEYNAINDTNNSREVESATSVYRDIMTEICDDADGRCLHPADLRAHGERARDAAVLRFHEQRDEGAAGFHPDRYLENLTEALVTLYLEFEERNVDRNEAAVNLAHDVYVGLMEPRQAGGAGWIDVFLAPDLDVLPRHNIAKNRAKEHFLLQRKYGGNPARDVFMEALEKKIEDSYAWYVGKLLLSVAAQVTSVFAMGAFAFKK